MAIVEGQRVIVKWNNANRKHYESLGYIFTKNNDEFEVKINHLTKGSKSEVKALCDWCKNEFTREMHLLNRNGHNHHYCSNTCQHLHRSEIAEINKPTKTCEECGKEYKLNRYELDTSKYCSAKCKASWSSKAFKGDKSSRYVERVSVNCGWCHADILRTPSYLKGRTLNFCNEHCRQSWHREVFVKTDEFIELARNVMLTNLSEGKIKMTETEPHVKINNILDQLEIKYENEKNVSDYSFDIYLPTYDLYVEINGGYWHCDSRVYNEINHSVQLDRIIKDKRKRTYLFKKYKKQVLYLWEYDIKNNLNACVRLLLEFIKNNGKLGNYHSFNYSLIDNNLIENQSIIIPYMERNFNEITEIVNLEVRKKVTRYNENKHITFDCEYCGKEKTQPLPTYMKAKNHFCSVKCKNLSQQVGNNTDQLVFIHKCAECNIEISMPNHRHLKIISGEQKNAFCSYECKNIWESKNNRGINNPRYKRIQKECVHCNAEYEVPLHQKDRSNFCSVECRQKSSQKRIPVNCLNCNNEVFKTPTDLKKNKTGQYFCSHFCSNQYKVKSNRETRTCEYSPCSNEFVTKKKSGQLFCSVKCRNKGIASKNKVKSSN